MYNKFYIIHLCNYLWKIINLCISLGLLSWAIIVTIFLNVSVAIVINLKIKIRHAARNGFDYTQLQNMSVDTPGPTSSTIPPTPTPPSPQPSVVSTPATVKHSSSLWLPVSKNTNRQKEIELWRARCLSFDIFCCCWGSSSGFFL